MICAWAIYTSMAEVGSKCFPGQNPEFQAHLRATVTRMDAYVLRNSKDATPETIASFKRQQGHTVTPADQLCRGDPIEMYRLIEKSDWAKTSAEIDRALARDGPPTWGTCL